jgi:hypothetical protein
MKTEDEITELTMLDASKVAGVASPANGTPFLLLKAAATAEDTQKPCTTCKGDGKILNNSRKCPDCNGTGNVAKTAEELGLVKCVACDGTGKPAGPALVPCAECGGAGLVKAEADDIENEVTKADEADEQEDEMTDDAEKAKLSAADRKKLPKKSFAYVDPKGKGHLPIHDENHVRAAMGRLSQQDFSDAPDPAKAKSLAARKIKAAASNHGIVIEDDSDVAQQAKKALQLTKDEQSWLMEDPTLKKGDVQDALDGTKTPAEAGHLATGGSELAGPVTDGVYDPPHPGPAGVVETGTSGVTSSRRGGESAYIIPAEDKINGPAVARDPATYMKAIAAASLIEAMGAIEEQRAAIKDGKFLQLDQPTGAAANEPSSMPWETYDAATLAQVAMVLASAGCAIDAIQQREAVEAASGQSSDYQDSWALGDAEQALEYALGIAARLAYGEAAAATAAGDATKSVELVEKLGRKLSGTSESALRAARDHLTSVLGDGGSKTASGAGSNSNEGETIQMEVTKSDFVASVDEIVKARLKAEKKAEKKAAKEAKKAAELAAASSDETVDEAEKNANNGGDISAADIKPKSEQDADDVNSVGGAVNSEYINKGLETAFETITKELGEVKGLVTRMGQKPRSGGPVLDGTPRGSFPAEGGRHSETVTKSESGEMIERLEKELEDTKDPQQAADLRLRITRERLYEAHLTGQI